MGGLAPWAGAAAAAADAPSAAAPGGPEVQIPPPARLAPVRNPIHPVARHPAARWPPVGDRSARPCSGERALGAPGRATQPPRKAIGRCCGGRTACNATATLRRRCLPPPAGALHTRNPLISSSHDLAGHLDHCGQLDQLQRGQGAAEGGGECRWAQLGASCACRAAVVSLPACLQVRPRSFQPAACPQTRHLPRFSASDAKILKQYLNSRLWLTGLGADLGGAVLQIAAFAMAPVSNHPAGRQLLLGAGIRMLCCNLAICHCGAWVETAGLHCRLHNTRQQVCRQQVAVVPARTSAPPCTLNSIQPACLPARPVQVSIVQPISGVGLVGLAVYSHLFLKEKLHSLEWGAVLLAFLGTLGLGATSSDGGNSAGDAAAAVGGADGAGSTAGAAGQVAAAAAGAAGQAAGAASGADAAAAAALQAAAGSGSVPGPPGAFRMLGVLLLLGAAVLAVSVVRHRRSHRSRRPGDRPAAATYGLQAGACFGLSAASCRIGFLLAQRGSGLWVALGLAGSVGLSSSGFILQTCGFKEGSAGGLAGTACWCGVHSC